MKLLPHMPRTHNRCWTLILKKRETFLKLTSKDASRTDVFLCLLDELLSCAVSLIPLLFLLGMKLFEYTTKPGVKDFGLVDALFNLGRARITLLLRRTRGGE
jgi:hypothetical protein